MRSISKAKSAECFGEGMIEVDSDDDDDDDWMDCMECGGMGEIEEGFDALNMTLGLWFRLSVT